MSRASQSGVTLIELMVVTAVVAILAAIAYPSYQAQVRKSRRSAVEAFMMEVATRQQQRMLDVRSYAGTLDNLGMTLPSDLNGLYTVSVAADAGPPPTFTVTAAPAGAQLQDHCGSLTLDETGTKAPDSCW